jgi:hypothetical protein
MIGADTAATNRSLPPMRTPALVTKLLEAKVAQADIDVARRVVGNMIDDPETARRLEKQRVRQEAEVRRQADDLAEWQRVARDAENQRASGDAERRYLGDAFVR